MTFDARLAVVTLATFATASAAGCVVALWLARRTIAGPPSTRATAWFTIRLLPCLVAAAATIQGVASFELFEPRGEIETFGIVLVGLALVGTALLSIAGARLALAIWATHRAVRRWMRSAEEVSLPGVSLPTYAITSSFPVVAVVGVWRPSLIVARQVLAKCTSDELAAILAHERQHLLSRDNVRRAILLSLPDPLAFMTAGGRLNARWHDAVEEAADDAASNIGPMGRVHLASALVHVARLAPAGQPAVMLPASALYRGENIERRVRRLLDAPEPCTRVRWPRWRRVLVAVCLVVAGALALHAMHEVVEAAVALLP